MLRPWEFGRFTPREFDAAGRGRREDEMRREDLLAVIAALQVAPWAGKGRRVHARDVLGRPLLSEQRRVDAVVERAQSAKRRRGRRR